MSNELIKEKIENYWNSKESINSGNKEVCKDIQEVMNLLDNGEIRVSEKVNGVWTANQWVKKAILLSFKTNNNSIFSSITSAGGGAGGHSDDRLQLQPPRVRGAGHEHVSDGSAD